VRTVFLGTSDFAVEVLRSLADSPHRPVLAVAPPDRPRGRGRKLAAPPVADAARELEIDLLQTANVNEAESVVAIEAAGAGAIAVCEFGQLIKEPLLSMLPMLNVHPSLLPRWRGAAPIERALMAGDTETGMTIFQLEAGLDSGPLALSITEPITARDNYGTLAARLARLGGEAMIEALSRLESGALELKSQPTEGITYAEKIEPDERRLDPSGEAATLVNAVRGLTPQIGVYLELAGDERLGVSAALPANQQVPAEELLVDGQRLLIGCADGAVELLEVKPPGKKSMATADYLRGVREPPALA